MLRHLIITAIALAATTMATAKTSIDSLLQCLDMAIDSSAYFVSVRQNRIDKIEAELSKTTDTRKKLQLTMSLYREYIPYKNDSTMACLNRCMDYAKQLADRHAENDCRAKLAFRCSTAGMYHEAFTLLSATDTTRLDEEGWHSYLVANSHLYSEMAYYSQLPELKKQYQAKADEYTNRILATFNHNDDEYLRRLIVRLYTKGDIEGALSVSDRWMAMTKKHQHSFAVAAFYRFMTYAEINKEGEMMHWLVESAINDVRNAVTDQGSLWEIAARLCTQPDNLQRSYKYIKFAWMSAQTFNTRVRSNQVTPILSLIETNYQEHISQANTELRVMVAVACLLLLVALALFFYANSKRRKLQAALEELNRSNNELKKLNAQLNDYNQRINNLNANLEQANTSLNESNKMKELYIGRFLNLCATYIDKTENLKRTISKRVRSHDYAALARMAEEKDEDWGEFYHNFDSAFLKLFPNFVDDFNALLQPDKRVALDSDGAFVPSLRIFALIRLGIDDSSKIAEFLHYSVNTIYNYRAKTKNAALGDRNDFEQNVKKIGMK